MIAKLPTFILFDYLIKRLHILAAKNIKKIRKLGGDYFKNKKNRK
ncbi:unnamed protein product [marine sediment metagenome]|uniref:Uncharacterized protein n=1 Tax=marine sediment metagenome TaxID=412755 RepID=X1I4F0_9ZZZZ